MTQVAALPRFSPCRRQATPCSIPCFRARRIPGCESLPGCGKPGGLSEVPRVAPDADDLGSAEETFAPAPSERPPLGGPADGKPRRVQGVSSPRRSQGHEPEPGQRLRGREPLHEKLAQRAQVELAGGRWGCEKSQRQP